MADWANPQDDTNSRRVVLANGSASEPSLTFSGDLTKGIYFDGTNIIIVGASGGASPWTESLGVVSLVNPTDEVRIGDKLSWNTDPNMNILFSTGQINHFIDGQNAGYFSANGLTLVSGTFLSTNSIQGPAETNTSEIRLDTAGSIAFTFPFSAGNVGSFDDPTGGDPASTNLVLYDTDSHATQRVHVGANDSAGLGFRQLRIANV